MEGDSVIWKPKNATPIGDPSFWKPANATPVGAANAADLNPDQLSPGPKWIGPIPIPNKGQTREMALNSIPAITGTIGSLPGVLTADPPLAIYGAGLGGSIGRAGELGLREAMGGPAASMAYLPKKAFGLNLPPVGQVAASIGNAGAIQAANQIVGEVAPKVFGAGSAKLYEAGVGQPAALTEKFPGVDFGKVAQREGVIVGSKVGREGSRQMTQAVKRSADAKRALQAEQVAAGLTVPADHPLIKASVDDLIGGITTGVPLYGDKADAVRSMWSEYLQGHGITPEGPPVASSLVDEYGGKIMTPGTPASRVDMTIPASEKLKQGSQGLAQNIIENRVAGKKVNPEIGAGLEKAFNDAIASGHKAVLEQVGGTPAGPMKNAAGQSIEEINKEIQANIGTRKAVRMAELRKAPLLNPASGPSLGFGIATAIHNPALGIAEFGVGHVGGRLLTDPRFLTSAGKALGSSELRNALRLGLPATLRDIELSPFSMDSTVTR